MNPKRKKNARQVILLYGGTSEERLVSTASAQNIVKYLPDPLCWFISPEGNLHETSTEELLKHKNPFREVLKPERPAFAHRFVDALPQLTDKIVYIGLHGTEGEDGRLQEFLEKNKTYFTGSGSDSSALCFNKIQAKARARELNLPVAEELELPIALTPEARVQHEKKLKDFFFLKKKIVVKPVANGSSFGLHIVKNEEDLKKAIQDLHRWDMMAEEFIEGRELTVGVLNFKNELRALPASEVLLEKGSHFDYEGKYLGRGTTEVTPAQISSREMEQAQDLALRAHRGFSCFGYTRTDMILTPSGISYFLETNTLPGMTAASFFPQQLRAADLPLEIFVSEMLDQAEARYQ